MVNHISIQILDSLLEANNDRVIIYSLVKNEIVYEDIKIILAACIKNSVLCSAQLVEERNKMISQINYETVPNQDFLNIWLVIDECLSIHEHGRISSLFTASENVFKTTYVNALNKDNLKHLSFRHKSLIWKQKELLKAS